MPDTPLHQLSAAGQSAGSTSSPAPSSTTATSRRSSTRASEGVTSNPTIFQSAIAEGDRYDDQLREVLKTEDEPKEIFLALAIRDIRDACDVLRPEWNKTGENARDGWVSLEVDPNLAHDTESTIAEAKRLHARGRPSQPLHQDPRDARGPARDRGDDRGRHPGQRHADLLARAPPRGRRGLRPRPPAATRTPAGI